LGVIGEYLSRVYDEVRQRPLYITRTRLGFDRSEDIFVDESQLARLHRQETGGDKF
jgi:hypothetical protein